MLPDPLVHHCVALLRLGVVRHGRVGRQRRGQEGGDHADREQEDQSPQEEHALRPEGGGSGEPLGHPLNASGSGASNESFLLTFTTLMINVVISDPLAVANELRPALLRLSRELRKETESLGVTSRQVTLLWLIRSNPGLSLRELAAEERISAPALSGHVDRLEKAGLIQRTRDEGDRRRVGLTLTEEGAAVLKRVRARRTSWLAERLKGLEPAELEAIEAALVPLGKLL